MRSGGDWRSKKAEYLRPGVQGEDRPRGASRGNANNKVGQHHGVHPAWVGQWKKAIQEEAKTLLEGNRGPKPTAVAEYQALFVEEAPAGHLPTQEATKRLGVSRQAVLQRVKRGELEAVHVRCGKRKGLRIRVIGGIPDLFDRSP